MLDAKSLDNPVAFKAFRLKCFQDVLFHIRNLETRIGNTPLHFHFIVQCVPAMSP